MFQGKLIIFSAPSGSGKTTIVRHLLKTFPEKLEFSISATSRDKRGSEQSGKDYHYISKEEFQKKILNNEFLEWEEVYAGVFYGTLISEVERIWRKGKHVIFDIDVEGGLNLKKKFRENSISIFVMPPSIKILEERLKLRQTDSSESISRRLKKAERELETAHLFDFFILNENLETAFLDAERIIIDFLS